MAVTDSRRVRDVVTAAQRQPKLSGDPAFAAVRRGQVGEPVLVRSPAGEPAFWLVPLLQGDLACGYAEVSLEGEVTGLASLGAGPSDRAGWVPAGYFAGPPAPVLGEIRARYPGAELAQPVFSYDRSPARWGWRIDLRSPEGRRTAVFVSPGSWYEGRADEGWQDLEG